MINKVTPSFILILVAAYLTLVRAYDLRDVNCQETVTGYPCSGYGLSDAQAAADRAKQLVYIYVGVTVAALIAFGVVITVCLFCACCPLYKCRHNQQTVYTSATTQRQPVAFYQQPLYNGQQINEQRFLQPAYPGFVYSPGQALPQTLNAPSYNGVIEYQINPRIGPYAGAPEEPPAYYQTSPQNQNMNTNFTSK